MGFRLPESDTTKMRAVVARPESCQQVVEGNSYYAYLAALPAAPLADAASLEIVFTTGETSNAYLWVTAQCGGNGQFKIAEGVTGVTGGNLFVPVNRNRQSTKTSTCGVLTAPTAVTLNGVIYQEIILGGTTGVAAGNDVTSEPYLLKRNTSYLFRLTNNSGQARIAEIQLQWCEL
jgi:hypothetical protein